MLCNNISDVFISKGCIRCSLPDAENVLSDASSLQLLKLAEVLKEKIEATRSEDRGEVSYP